MVDIKTSNAESNMNGGPNHSINPPSSKMGSLEKQKQT